MWPLVLWWALLEGLGWLALPLTFSLFGRRSAHGYPFAKILAVLLLTYVSWLSGFAIQMSAAVGIGIGALALSSLAAAWWNRAELLAWLRADGLRTILFHDLLWTAGFLFFAWQRSMVPDINGAEKFMDFAFFNGLKRTTGMPPPDPWMSGETINYYYFGYLMFATLARIAALPTWISYNLCVATVGGLALAETGAVVLAITQRWGFALLGGAMSALIGNLDGFLQFLEKGTVHGMDYWRSSRVVARGDTINEFPYFSTIHGDLHPHFMVLPVGIFLLAILLDERLFPSRPEEQPAGAWRAVAPWLLVTFVFGAMIAISPWELPAAGLVVLLLAGRWQPLSPLLSRARLLLLLRMLGMVAVGYVLFLPFYRHFIPPTVGPGPNETCIGPACFAIARTSLAQFLTVFGALLFAPAVLVARRAWSQLPGGGEGRHLLVAAAVLAVLFTTLLGNGVLPLLVVLVAAALISAYTIEGPERAGYLLIAAASVALLACELVYLKDSYGDKLYRMNTVFKLYFQAWTMLAIAAPWSLHRLLAERWQWSLMPRAVTAAMALLLAASACYPLGITTDRMGSPWATLDGNAYLERYHPEDFAAINWLRAHAVDEEVILEASGNPYSYYARYSANTGLPTVLGWENHEGLWRKGDARVPARRQDVTRMYNDPSLAAIEPLLDRYHVRYIVVGELERKDYSPAGVEKFAALDVAFRSGNTVIYSRKPR